MIGLDIVHVLDPLPDEENPEFSYVIKVVDSGETAADELYEYTDKKTCDNCIRYGFWWLNSLDTDYQELSAQTGSGLAESRIISQYERDLTRKSMYMIFCIVHDGKPVTEDFYLNGSSFSLDPEDDLDLTVKKFIREQNLMAECAENLKLYNGR